MTLESVNETVHPIGGVFYKIQSILLVECFTKIQSILLVECFTKIQSILLVECFTKYRVFYWWSVLQNTEYPIGGVFYKIQSTVEISHLA